MSLEAKHKVLEELAAAHIAFKEAVLHIPEDSVTAPMHGDWCAKDLIAHVSSWDEITALDMHRIAQGHVPQLAGLKSTEVDDWNDFMMRGRRLFPMGQVMDELEDRYDMLVEAVEAVPEGMFGEGSLAWNMLALDMQHHREHAKHIREWREREGI
jgi:hypothetical protein